MRGGADLMRRVRSDRGGRRALLVSGLLVAANGCGNSNSSPEDAVLGSSILALATNATDISRGVPDSILESETAAVSIPQTSVSVVAYNLIDSAHIPRSGQRCKGYALLGVSYFTDNSTWRKLHIHIPVNGIASLRGDPALTIKDVGSSYEVRVSSLAISNTTWNSLPTVGTCPDGSGSVDRALIGDTTLDRLCVAKVTLPKDGSAASVGNPICTSNDTSGPLFDGTSVFMDRSNHYYQAAWNQSNAVYASVVTENQGFPGIVTQTLPAPFPGITITGHAIFVPGADQPELIAPSGSNFWETVFTPSGAVGTWSTPQLIPASFVGMGVVTLRDGTSLRSRGYSAVRYTSGPSPSLLNLVYETGASTLTSVLCFSAPSWGCQATGWSSPANHVALLPALAVSHVPNGSPFPSVRLHVTYWDNNAGGSASQLTLMASNPLGASSSTPLVTETPCPFQGYWGDYDQMFVQNDYQSNARVWRAFTDSTDGACNPGSDYSSSIPQHVSAISYAPAP